MDVKVQLATTKIMSHFLKDRVENERKLERMKWVLGKE